MLSYFSRPGNQLQIAVAAVAIGIVAIGWAVAINDFGAQDLERFEQRSGIDFPDQYGNLPWLLTWSRGDGQAFMTIAADLDASDAAQRLGRPGYRYSRIGFSVAIWLFAFGTSSLLPVGVVAANLTFLGLTGWIVGRRVGGQGLAVCLAVVPGIIIATAAGTAEILGVLLTLIALTASRLPGGIAAAILGITRPEFGLVLLLRGKEGALRLVLCGASAVGIRVLASALGLSARFGQDALSLPLGGYIEAIPLQALPHALVTAAIACFGIATIVRGALAERGWRLMAFVSVGVWILVLGPEVLENPINTIRVLMAFPLIWIQPSDWSYEGKPTHLAAPNRR